MIGCEQTFIDHLKNNQADFDQNKFVKILNEMMYYGEIRRKENEVK